MKELCKRGHKLSGGNVYYYERDGRIQRQCNVCRLAYFRERYRRNKKSILAYAKDRYRKIYADPLRRAVLLERSRKWAQNNREKKNAIVKRWRESPNGRAYIAKSRTLFLRSSKGQAYLVRHNFNLPSNAPDELVKTCQLLRAIRKEMRNEHNRA